MIDWSRKQAELFLLAEHPAHTFAVHGPVRSGKTMPAVFGFMRNACKNFAGYKFAICSRTAPQLEAIVVMYMRWFAREYGMTIKQKKTHLEVASWLNGPPNEFYPMLGKDVSSQYIASGYTTAGAILDESQGMPESFVNVVRERSVSVPGHKVVLIANPEGPQHWFKVNLINEANGVDIADYPFQMSDNETLTAKEVKELHDTHPAGVERQRRIFGEWVAATGMIYPHFEAAIKSPPTNEKPYRHSISIDHAPKRVSHALRFDWYTTGIWCAEEWRRDGQEAGYMDDTEQVHAIHRSLVGDRNVADWFVDPAALEFSAALGNIIGKRPKPADNDVREGIEKTSQLLANGSLYISNKCRHLIKELRGYVWDPKASDQGEDKPLKRADHGCDSLRYFAYTSAGIQARRMRRPRRLRYATTS